MFQRIVKNYSTLNTRKIVDSSPYYGTIGPWSVVDKESYNQIVKELNKPIVSDKKN